MDSPKSSTLASPKIGSNESGYMSLTNGESNVMSSSSKASSIWGDKSLWNLSNSPNSTSSMQTANSSMCSSDGKDSFWHSSTSSPISSASQYNHLNSLWGCSSIKSDPHEESLGSIWNIPPATSSPKLHDSNFEAPLPPPISYNQKSQPQMLRPQDIGGMSWSGLSSANNGNNHNNHINSNNNNINNNNNHCNKMKDPVGALWAHPTPPNLPLTLQAQNYNLLSTNSKFQSPIKPMGVSNNFMSQTPMTSTINTQSSTSCNMQLLSDDFLSYFSMIN